MRVTYDDLCPHGTAVWVYCTECAAEAGQPLLLQPDLYGGPGQVVGEQGYLFDCGRAERKQRAEPVNPDQGELFTNA